MSDLLKLADAELWHMREVAHYNGGSEWFGYGHQCIEQPRLYRMDRYTRKDRSVASTWSVDGIDCAGLEEAIERLNSDPDVSADELTMLGALTQAFEPISHIRQSKTFASLPNASEILHHWLSRKGLVWAENGLVRRTDLGERLLRSLSTQEDKT